MLSEQERDLYAESIRAQSVEAEEFNLVKLLGLHPYPDGNQWCVLWGKDLQEGVAGFGETPILAVYDFNKNVRIQKLPSKKDQTND
jgi:hypothetical protein